MLVKSGLRINIPKKVYYVVSVDIPEFPEYKLLGFVDLAKAVDPIFKNYTDQQKEVIDSLDIELKSEFNRTWTIGIIIFFIVIVVLSTAFAAVGVFLAKFVTKPIVELRDAVSAISQGDFDVQVKESGTVETIHLARTFNNLGERLKKYMKNLKDETAKLESVKSELRIACKIQKSLLPVLTKDFIRSEFQLNVFFHPSKEVGGDFYDFFYIDDQRERLVLVLGDVSGKGVPAALFVGVIKTTLRNFCRNFNDLEPGEILKRVNSDIYSNNPEGMFATIFLMYYDLKNGSLVFANAGHHASILIDSSGKGIHEFGENDDSILGIFGDSEYKTDKIELKKSDRIICFTDGLTDAVSAEGEHFGISRLINIIKNNIDKSSEEIIKIASSEALEFQNNNLFDDITLLALTKNT
jgi:sigma-B regulation protein RsbU (phosphoserine phosphatase)